MKNIATEIVINATLVTEEPSAILYEFVLGTGLKVTECGCIESLSQKRLRHITDPVNMLDGLLFELNHVRVNPEVDNTFIIRQLGRDMEQQAGVVVQNQPQENDVQMCFAPMGELSDRVRFYVGLQGRLTFLSPSVKLHVVSSDQSEGEKRESKRKPGK